MMQRRLYLSISLLWHAKNDSFNLYINRALLDRELLDRVSWTSTALFPYDNFP